MSAVTGELSFKINAAPKCAYCSTHGVAVFIAVNGYILIKPSYEKFKLYIIMIIRKIDKMLNSYTASNNLLHKFLEKYEL